MSLKSYVTSRILLTIPMVFLLLTLVFVIIRVMPGDPALLHFERHVTPEVLAEFRRRLGLDLPIWQQYINYIAGLFRGDFGISMQDYSPIIQHLRARFPATLELSIYSGLFAIVFGVILGVISARKYDTVTDHSLRLIAIITYAIPVFFLGMIFQIIFSVWLGILPSGLRFDPHTVSDPERAALIQRAALERGLIIEKGGRKGAVLRFLPPLIISATQIDFVAKTIKTAIESTQD